MSIINQMKKHDFPTISRCTTSTANLLGRFNKCNAIMFSWHTVNTYFIWGRNGMRQPDWELCGHPQAPHRTRPELIHVVPREDSIIVIIIRLQRSDTDRIRQVSAHWKLIRCAERLRYFVKLKCVKQQRHQRDSTVHIAFRKCCKP